MHWLEAFVELVQLGARGVKGAWSTAMAEMDVSDASALVLGESETGLALCRWIAKSVDVRDAAAQTARVPRADDTAAHKRAFDDGIVAFTQGIENGDAEVAKVARSAAIVRGSLLRRDGIDPRLALCALLYPDDDERCGRGLSDDAQQRLAAGAAHYALSLPDGNVDRLVDLVQAAHDANREDGVVETAASVAGVSMEYARRTLQTCVAHYWLNADAAVRVELDPATTLITITTPTGSFSAPFLLTRSTDVRNVGPVHEIHMRTPSNFLAFACVNGSDWHVAQRRRAGGILVDGINLTEFYDSVVTPLTSFSMIIPAYLSDAKTSFGRVDASAEWDHVDVVRNARRNETMQHMVRRSDVMARLLYARS